LVNAAQKTFAVVMVNEGNSACGCYVCIALQQGIHTVVAVFPPVTVAAGIELLLPTITDCCQVMENKKFCAIYMITDNAELSYVEF